MKLKGQSQVPLGAMRDFIKNRNPKFNPILLDYYYQWEQVFGIRADLAVCQAIKETGWFASWWSQQPRNNYCGLGVTGETKKTLTKNDVQGEWTKSDNGLFLKGYSLKRPAVGVAAHMGHLWAYVGAGDNFLYLDSVARDYDPRFDIARQNVQNHKWVITDTSDLDGRWAVPGKGYGTGVDQIFYSALQSAGRILTLSQLP